LSDQAGALRDIIATDSNSIPKSDSCRVISITSGKGGVGKSTFSIFLAKSMASQGKKVLLFDGDMGLANLHILLGVTTQKNILNFTKGEASLEEIIYPVEENIDLLAGSSGASEIADLSSNKTDNLISNLNSLTQKYDFIIVDGGAGIHNSVIKLALAGDDTIVVLTPDPTSLSDAYSAIKVLASKGKKDFKLVVNMVETSSEGAIVLEKITLLTEKFLGVVPTILGELPRNRKLGSCIKEDRSILAQRGLADYSIKINNISSKLTGNNSNQKSSFFNRLFRE
jgi:flagellar biosynthesis protein FlhG